MKEKHVKKKIAEKDKSAIGMFNATGFDSLQAIVSAAEELNKPVIIAHAEVHNVFNDISMVGPAMVAVASPSPSVPRMMASLSSDINFSSSIPTESSDNAMAAVLNPRFFNTSIPGWGHAESSPDK